MKTIFYKLHTNFPLRVTRISKRIYNHILPNFFDISVSVLYSLLIIQYFSYNPNRKCHTEKICGKNQTKNYNNFFNGKNIFIPRFAEAK